MFIRLPVRQQGREEKKKKTGKKRANAFTSFKFLKLLPYGAIFYTKGYWILAEAKQ